ncbi:hypothetical protein JZX76_13695 [Haloarcula hispanica]|uniref:Uncharacterized protein n=1 Tax=Haloarcula hispanica TaxID=51589 RepID=A0A482T5Y0_HALHI|nr:hypothetical protein [Haloarcula hispanica]MCJ0620517.1 hypothetical protein [Haloarcula hispanica]RYJ10906.1 hypothetical protein ELS20_13575 [Haloarcula hispanica]
MEFDLVLDSALLVLGVFSLLAIPVVLAQSAQNTESESKLERVAPLLLSLSYVLSKLVPGRFITVSPGVESAVGTLTLVLLVISIYFMVVR